MQRLKAVPFKVHIDAVARFRELERKKIGPGFVETGRMCSFILDAAALKRRMRFLMQMSCANEHVLAIRFAEGSESQTLNKSYRGKPAPTDVLSFSSFAQNIELAKMGVLSVNDFSLGDLIVCVPVCYVQAKEHRVSISSELERMIVHGICHLKGFDHERSAQAHFVMEGVEAMMRKAVARQFGRPDWARIAEID